jgi:endonuclease-3
MPEALAAKRARARRIVARLEGAYPDATIALRFETPLELLVATILAAQCTDERVNQVTGTLFRKYRTAADWAKADAATLEDEVRSTGFFRAKTRSILGMARGLLERHAGEVPRTLEALTALPGVGRKTANVVLGNAFGKDEGFVVDTHVGRLSIRLAFTRQTDPVKVEQDLNLLVPKGRRTLGAHLLIAHGRTICIARKPRCSVCPVNPLCPKVGVKISE